jgi:release factor glutamine methyltransferase
VNVKTVFEILTLSTEYLKQRFISSSRRQAEELLADALRIKRMQLYMEFDRPLTDRELERCRDWLRRRGKGEPLQYIRGEVEFFDCSFKVTPDVLIPRQETEILVDRIAQELVKMDLSGKVLWDICCGSGCIGIALKKKFPALQVVLVDICEKALKVAQENAQRNEVETEYLLGDMLVPLKGRQTDFFVCNPPYISESEYDGLEVEVRGHEPKKALVSGVTGLEFYERLAQELPTHLKAGGRGWFEIGSGQGTALKDMFRRPCWKDCQVGKDWAGHERFFSLEIE